MVTMAERQPHLHLQGEWAVAIDDGHVEMETWLSGIRPGPAPELPDLAVEYPLAEGRLEGRGLRWLDGALQVLWQTEQGVPAGWQVVDDWNEVRALERAQAMRPGKMQCHSPRWLLIERAIRNAVLGGREL